MSRNEENYVTNFVPALLFDTHKKNKRHQFKVSSRIQLQKYVLNCVKKIKQLSNLTFETKIYHEKIMCKQLLAK